ncbi:hypothetical protein COT03_00915 [Candidatus Shapirobacteria bacterium CG07_land_8_20_14_0_80_39_18]|uniref:Methyltransferase type 11 domain-containing protein n=1 Tax=Candidatus Shapirobacteria bacterium CG07_land_8_20_14_0_80_39_18 TaxID=1974882 RepID=A0A2M6YRS7_9BACT|nr:MAG: hypothetical protein COT03_00915 [Candidatus Shapirobacteria bacterium CG07_land_8_20_14_0_80_39_18]
MTEHESFPAILDEVWSKEVHLGLQRENAVLVSTIIKIMGGSVEGKRLLEIGSGRAVDSLSLAARGAKSYVLDFSSKSLDFSTRLARERGITIVPLRADARCLPFAGGSFDLIYSQGLVEHYQPPDKLMEEQVRVVRPGGYVLVDVPQLVSIQAITKKVLMGMDKWPFGWERDYTEPQLRKLFEKFGLEVIDLCGWGFRPPLHMGIRTFLKKFMAQRKKEVSGQGDNDGRVNNEGGSFQNSWFVRHFANCIGVVGQKL